MSGFVYEAWTGSWGIAAGVHECPDLRMGPVDYLRALGKVPSAPEGAPGPFPGSGLRLSDTPSWMRNASASYGAASSTASVT